MSNLKRKIEVNEKRVGYFKLKFCIMVLSLNLSCCKIVNKTRLDCDACGRYIGRSNKTLVWNQKVENPRREVTKACDIARCDSQQHAFRFIHVSWYTRASRRVVTPFRKQPSWLLGRPQAAVAARSVVEHNALLQTPTNSTYVPT